MKWVKNLAGAVSTLLPAKALSRASGVEVLLPYHHVVSDEYLPHIKGLYSYKSMRQFEEDLDWLLARYRPLHPDELATSIINKEPLRRGGFLPGFDDGFRELHDVVAPILLRKGVPAIFFINPAFVDNRELFYRCKLSLVIEKAASDGSVSAALSRHLDNPPDLRQAILSIQYPQRQRADELGRIAGIDFDDFLRQHKPFLNTQQVQSLGEQGFVFGGHSMDHPSYRFLNLEEQVDQTVKSVEFAQKFNPSPHRYFAFPHQDAPVHQAFFDEIKKEGRSITLFGLQNGRNEKSNRVWHRFNAENPAQSLARQVSTIQLYNAALRATGRRTVVRI